MIPVHEFGQRVLRGVTCSVRSQAAGSASKGVRWKPGHVLAIISAHIFFQGAAHLRRHQRTKSSSEILRRRWRP
jgi:hypothetical protein